MRALVTGTGRSGTLWTATALRECCGVDARHESVRRIEDIDHVEVNSRFVTEIRSEHAERLVLVHLVRDGRDVVSSILDRRPECGFKEACYAWTIRNQHVMALVPDDRRFQLERLVQLRTDMDALSSTLGGRLDPQLWEKARYEVLNTGGRSYPYWREWGTMQTDAFWEICGETMVACGYERTNKEDDQCSG